MHLKQFITATALAGTLGILGCNGGDRSSLVIEGDTINNPPAGGSSGGGSTISDCPDWAAARSKDAAGSNVCQLPSSILVDRVLTVGTTWYLADRVTVGNGNGEMSAVQGTLATGAPVVNATLTIEPGTQIKAASGTFANLIITRGSRLAAVGTAAAPIVFSSDDADLTGSGEWGGIILHGYGDHNECPGLPCNVDAEGESGFAAGFGTPADDSGHLSYVVVTEGGFEFAPGNEINGISLVGVGSGTRLDHIQVNANSDDGIEFYGGAANIKYLVLTGNLDDSIDWDEGYTGNIQYAIVKQSADTDGNVVEGDTEGTTAFLSKPTLANVTFIGAGDAAAMMVLKASSGGFLHNAVLTRDAANTSIQSCVTVNGAGAQANRNTSIVFNHVIAHCAAFGDAVLDASTVHAVDPLLDARLAAQAPQARLATPLDWTVVNATYSQSTAIPGYLDATDYLGAVDPDGTDRWYEGWTLPGSI